MVLSSSSARNILINCGFVAGNDLVPDKVDAWDEAVKRYWLGGGRPQRRDGLSDFGVYTGNVVAPPLKAPSVVFLESQAFVKFLGSKNDRLDLSAPAIEEVKRAGCHWSVCYPTNRRPRIVNDDVIVFMGRLTRNPNDVRIFGRAIGIAYEEERDDATEADISLRPWRERWSHYIRVHHAEFVDGTMKNGVSLNELMSSLGSDSFESTQNNSKRGEGNMDSRRAYGRQPHVKLSPEGFTWLSQRLQMAFDTHGKIPHETLDGLDWPNPTIVSPPQP